MSRFIKEKIVERYQTRFRDVSDVAVVSTKGVDVHRMTALRSALRAKGIRALTVQNRLGKRALESTGLAAVGTLLRGPSTLIWGGEGIVDLAKALASEAKTIAKLEIRGGVSGGQVLSKADIEALSRLPGRGELIGQVVARAIGQASRVAAQVLAMGGRLAAQVREVEKKAPPPEAPAAEPAAAAAPAAPPAPEAPPAPAAPPASDG
jgi:large subunit ribosomal protein L10